MKDELAQSKSTIYAWARPVKRSPWGDHTFVTDYEVPFDGEPPSRSWYCAGGVYSSHDPQVRMLLKGEADLRFAEFICKPDDSSVDARQLAATAGIIYGVHGVCHQIANRVLHATGTQGTTPARVDGAEGYFLSHLFYGDYGKNEVVWRAALSRYQHE